ncbi:hypothetical protein BDV25DRAFT_148385 [Aspergillus avenaceus]|uniref:Uncharacterized protein n=1 Tax=Aspergillus avenaceus TaxID=36643 RepID=A0A5N6U5N8_ASPAV|nr:hypothetical protein BDV25DRAFT_148385 [Aspergillus avenaceus]
MRPSIITGAFLYTSLATAWNITAYSNTDCTGYITSLTGEQSWGCYWLAKDGIKSMKAGDMPEGWTFIASSGGNCNNFHQRGGNGCYTQGQGFQSFSFSVPSNSSDS